MSFRERGITLQKRHARMALHKLTYRTFNEQMFRHGYLSEQIPECFTSESFADNAPEILNLVRKSIASAPTSISSFKRDSTRRIISIPNPYAFASTVKFMGEHWNVIKQHSVSENSLSKITYCRRYNAGVAETLNNEKARTHFKSRSALVRNAKACLAASLGFRYRLKIDIASCYDSIDSRSILWAIYGRKTAERYMVTGPSQEERIVYDFAHQLSKCMIDQNNRNPSGIITGPYTSRIFSEIVLARIDADLRKRLGERFLCGFRRYVDDYRFFFKTEAEARHALQEIEDVLETYGLRLNHSKTAIDVYPFDYIKPIRRRFRMAYEEDGMSGLLNEAAVLYGEGETGAFKYALKMAVNETLKPGEADLVLSSLFNINLVSPECSAYIVAVIEANRECFRTDKLAEIVSEQLVQDLERNLDQETMNLLFFVKHLDLPLPTRSILEVLRAGCDPAVIIALDLWCNHRDAVKGTSYETRLVNAAKRDMEERLADESMDGEHWLLLYEAHRHGLLRSIEINRGATGSFFEELDRLGVDFYRA